MNPRNTQELSSDKIPTHVAIIMDGNGRWAKARGLPRIAGHRAGTENLRQIIKACVEFKVPCLTIYAFSTENWGRPPEEVEGLLNIVTEVIERELEELNREGVRLRHLGSLNGLKPPTQEKVKHAIEVTKNNTRLNLNIAFNYGGRDEIVHAIKNIIKEGINPEEITPEVVSQHLYTAELPEPDLIIRTSGEMRTSNFLIWQSAYAELVVVPTLWPDFDKEELKKALIEFGQRERRFGRVSGQVILENK